MFKQCVRRLLRSPDVATDHTKGLSERFTPTVYDVSYVERIVLFVTNKSSVQVKWGV